MSQLLGSIITDCEDDNTRTRQALRFTSLFGVAPTFMGVGSYGGVAAAGNLVEQLDVLTNFPLALHNKSKAIVLVNVAPRGADIKQKWDNGTPFCYFIVGTTTVLSTYEGYCLSLARDLDIVTEVQLFDIPTVTQAAMAWGDLTQAEAERINNTQFRSLEFLPLAAWWLHQGKPVPATTASLNHLPSTHNKVWHIDNFGNIKTTLTAKDCDFAPGETRTLVNGTNVTCYTRLADVPTGEAALTLGSSGYGDKRFIELVVQKGRASDMFGLTIGDKVLDL